MRRLSALACLASLVSVFPFWMQPVGADQNHDGSGQAILERDPGGVTASALANYSADIPSASDTQAATPQGGGIEYLGLIPHSCVPTTRPNVGISFSNVLYEAASADCIAFSAPPPVRRNGAPRDGSLDSSEELLAIASDEMVALAERPQLEVAPARRGVTGLRSFFWLQRRPDPVSATARVPGLAVTAEAYPVRYIWDFGDGGKRATSHIGRPWTRRRPGNIGYMYETKGHYEVGTEVIWRARWRINSGSWQPLGYFVTAASELYRVREVAPGLTRSRR